MPTDPAASQGVPWKEKRMDVERAFPSALGIHQGALSTKPAGIVH